MSSPLTGTALGSITAGAYSQTEYTEYMKLAAKIDGIAKLMCEELSLDPETMVQVPLRQTLTPAEESSYATANLYGGYAYTVGATWNSTVAATTAEYEYAYWPDGSVALQRVKPSFQSAPSATDYNTIVTIPRWRTFRRDAAIQIAALRAHNTYMLTEA